MSKNNEKPLRNFLVLAMNKKSKCQVFHHKTDERGGATNEQRDLLEQALTEDAQDDGHDDHDGIKRVYEGTYNTMDNATEAAKKDWESVP